MAYNIITRTGIKGAYLFPVLETAPTTEAATARVAALKAASPRKFFSWEADAETLWAFFEENERALGR